MPGVVGYFDHKDIPGDNNHQLFAYMLPTAPRKEIFSTGKITHVGQVIGAICADTPEQAQQAARYVCSLLSDRYVMKFLIMYIHMYTYISF